MSAAYSVIPSRAVVLRRQFEIANRPAHRTPCDLYERSGE